MLNQKISFKENSSELCQNYPQIARTNYDQMDIFFDIKSLLCYKFFTSKHSIQREAIHDKKNQSPWDGCEES